MSRSAGIGEGSGNGKNGKWNWEELRVKSCFGHASHKKHQMYSCHSMLLKIINFKNLWLPKGKGQGWDKLGDWG